MENSGELCERCQRIDLDDALNPHQALPTEGRKITSLGEINEELKNSVCPLCRLSASIYVPIPLDPRTIWPGHQLRAFKLSSLEVRSQEENEATPDPLVVLGVTRDPPFLFLNERADCLNYGVIAPIVTSDCDSLQERGSKAHLVKPTKPNYAQIRSWLDYCKDHHGNVCNLGSGQIHIPLMCIDCSTRNIVQLTEGSEYYALSYVWGDKMLAATSIKHGGSLKTLPSSPIAPVIEDAIVAVQSLGGRYLWVDKYCINQEDDNEKHLLIQNMDRIYEGACATIIAVDNKDSEARLPGVGNHARKSQASCHVGDWHLVTTLPHMSSPLQRSAWITRGWTYQEAVLSRRCIFFTDEQVYFTCRNMNCCEALDRLHVDSDLCTGNRGLLSTNMFDPQEAIRDKFKGTKVKREGLWIFTEHLSRYKLRNLTFPSDALNAFQGIISNLQYCTVWGVPIAISSTTDDGDDTLYDMGFARGLSWGKEFSTKSKFVSLRRVPDFPSWSWAGWIGPISSTSVTYESYYEVDSECHSIEPSTFQTHFNLGLEDGRQLSLKDFYHSIVVAGDRPVNSQTLFCECLVVRVRFQRPSCVDDVNPAKESWGYICPCHLTELHRGSRLKEGDVTPVSLFQQLAENSDTLARTYDQLWDCIVLSQRIKEYSSEGNFRLVIIERDGDVAQRVGDIDMPLSLFQRLEKSNEVIKLV